MMILKCIAADYRKTKGLYFRTAHLVIPVCAAAVFLAYYANVTWDVREKAEAYYQALGCGFPVLIGLFGAMLAEQEASVSFQAMLSAVNKRRMFYSKLMLLIAGGTGSVFLASVLFGLGNIYVLKQSVAGMNLYVRAAFVLITGNIFCYIFHWFLALRFNRGVGIMAGITEGLAAALLLTGLGDGIWCYVPCAWAARLTTCMVLQSAGIQAFDTKCRTAVFLCAALTVCGFVLSGIWADRWEGQQSGD